MMLPLNLIACIDHRQRMKMYVFETNHFNSPLLQRHSVHSPTSLLDPIPTNLLVECVDTLVDTMTSVINQSLGTGKVPN